MQRNFLKKIIFNHGLIRLLFLPSSLFILWMLLHAMGDYQSFLLFVKSWRFAIVVSFGILMLHMSLELKAALEDYIKGADVRCIALKAVYLVAACAVGVVGIFVGSL